MRRRWTDRRLVRTIRVPRRSISEKANLTTRYLMMIALVCSLVAFFNTSTIIHILQNFMMNNIKNIPFGIEESFDSSLTMAHACYFLEHQQEPPPPQQQGERSSSWLEASSSDFSSYSQVSTSSFDTLEEIRRLRECARRTQESISKTTRESAKKALREEALQTILEARMMRHRIRMLGRRNEAVLLISQY
jgi:hypothetical protein